MTRAEAKALILKYNAGQCSEEECQLVEDWYDQFAIDENSDLTDADLEHIAAEMWAALPEEVNLRKAVKLWPRIAVAAAIMMMVTAGIWFFTHSPESPNHQLQRANQHDVLPGRNTAILVLDNGEKIKLKESKTGVVIDASKLTYNDGSAVNVGTGTMKGTAVAKNTMLTALTPRGGSYQVILPDGTKVWLNAASSLRFPSTFANAPKRKVFLSGEAYFEVSKVSLPSLRGKRIRQPFVVETAQQEVEVLGTHFNISSYADEPDAKTSLLEGQVRVSSLNNANSQLLKPGEQSILSPSGAISIALADVKKSIAWKNEKFSFDNESITSIMRKLSRWYNVDVIYQGDLSNTSFTGSISSKLSLKNILDRISRTEAIHFKIEGRRVIVMP